ncbi:MAG: Internalin-A precursor [Actinomycetota bacterium]
MFVSSPNVARAYDTEGLMFYYNFSDLASAADNTTIADLSGNNRTGTIRGSGLTYNPTTRALTFPGGSNGTGYLNLSGSFSTFTEGITIEFEGEFGNNLSQWERIFDFGIPGGVANDFWVGQMAGSHELALETWINGVNQGRCHTATDGSALDNSRTFSKWLITVDSISGCRIYKDGVELQTQIKNGDYTSDTAVQAHGSAYPLPAVSDRTANFVGRSNWEDDDDFEGSIRYLRLYNRALTPTEVLDNATNDQPRAETNSGSLAATGFDSTIYLLAAGALVTIGALLWRRRGSKS